MTIAEILKLTEDFFAKKLIKNARLDAEILLAEVLKTNRLNLYLQQDKPLKEDEINLYREYVKQRATHKPIQYIIGHTFFYGNKIFVNQNVLIPRPDTEILVERAIEIIKIKKYHKILEVGFGSGAILVSLAKELPNVKFTGIDISKKALEIAKKNIEAYSLSNVELRVEDIKKFNSNDQFDMIISNPPYISKTEFEKLDKEVKEYEPQIALTDSGDGLTYYRIIIEQSSSLLRKNGTIIFEIGYNQFEDVKKLLENNNFENIFYQKDYNNHIRVIGGEKI